MKPTDKPTPDIVLVPDLDREIASGRQEVEMLGLFRKITDPEERCTILKYLALRADHHAERSQRSVPSLILIQ